MVRVRVYRRLISKETIKVMEHAAKLDVFKQKQLICLGVIANNESISGRNLAKQLALRNADELRSWIKPLLEREIVETNKGKTSSIEYRVSPAILKDSDYRGRTTLKRIENYRIKALILEDLKIYKRATLHEIQERIGSEIDRRKIWAQLQDLEKENMVRKSGANRWIVYELISD